MKRSLLILVMIFAHISAGSAGSVTLDPTFNGTGFQLQEFSNSGALGSSIAVQSDGKIVVGGTMLVGNNIGDYASMRLLTTGILDTTFDVDGRIVTDLGPFDVSSSMLIQPDGKIVLGGERFASLTNDDFAATRYLPNGMLDNSFDLNGIVATNRAGFSDEHCYGMVLQTDGKLVLVGTTAVDDKAQTDLMMVRYNPDGSLDTSFAGNGILVISFQNVSESANAVAIQPDGKIIVAGYLFNGIKNDFLMMRLMPDGSLDTSFGTNGQVISSINGSNNVIKTMAIKPDGKIVVGGSVTTSAALVQYDTNGTIDNSFGINGMVTQTESINKLILTPSGKIVTAGTFNSKFSVSRYAENGSRDLTFNNGQSVNPTIPNNQCSGSSIVLQNDGKIIVGGTCFSSLNRMVVARLVEATAKSPFDLDGDGKTDLSIFRPNGAASEWWWLKSSTGGNAALQFGASTDRLAPVDFTGDGKTDVAFWRPETGQWFVLRSEDFSFYAFPFGATGDVPVPADYDGDGKADAAVFRESATTWFINRSSGGTDIVGFGAAGDKPVNADYDGDGKSDIAIFRPSGANGAEWWVRRSSNASVFALQFGSSTDKAVPGDFTGDGKADVAFWRPSTGFWNVLRSEDFSYYAFPFGANGDVAVPGDYDGDGKLDAAVFRPSSATWFANRSTAGTLIQQFGQTGDVPVPSAFVR